VWKHVDFNFHSRFISYRNSFSDKGGTKQTRKNTFVCRGHETQINLKSQFISGRRIIIFCFVYNIILVFINFAEWRRFPIIFKCLWIFYPMRRILRNVLIMLCVKISQNFSLGHKSNLISFKIIIHSVGSRVSTKPLWNIKINIPFE
jgi:hypothetical protein